MLAYTITNTQPWTYLDGLRNPVSGFRVTFSVGAVNESHVVYVPRLETALVKAEIEKFLKEREALMGLGK